MAWGADAASLAGPLGEYGATTVYDVGDLGGALPGVPVAAAMAALVEGGNAPDAILFPATYDGRDVAGRLSAKLDRPVLTNVTGLVESDGGLSSQHPVFGGSQIVTARFTGDGPGHLRHPGQVVRGRAVGRRRGDGRRRSGARRRGDQHGQGRRAPRRGAQRARSSTRRPSSSRAAAGWARRRNYALIEELAKLLHGAAGASRGPSSTPAGCPTRTRSARPARPSSRPSTWPAGSRARPSTWSA